MGNVIKHHWNTTVTGGLVNAVLNEPISANDENANEFSVSVQNANFESATCQGFFIRGDGMTIILDGQVSGKTASVVLAPNCYNVTGRFTITVKVTKGDSTTSWLRVEGYVKATSTDDYAFAGDDSAPLDILLEAAERVDEAVSEANEAAAAANEAAQAAENALAAVEETLTSIQEDYTELDGEVGQLSQEMEDNNCVNYLGRLPDIAETTKNGLTYSCTDGVFTYSGTASATVFVRLYEDTVDAIDWWVPGEKLFITYAKTPGSTASPQLRFYKNNTTEIARFDGLAGKYVYEIPDDPEMTKLQVRLHVSTGVTANATITGITIANSYTNKELTDLARNAGRAFQHNVAMFGDSITMGRDGNDEGTMVICPFTIPDTVGKLLGVNVTNYGVGSMGWLAKGGSMNAYEKLASVDLTAYDTVTLCFGVNDHHENLGTWDSNDEETVMGQFHKCIRYIYQQNPSCRVIVIGPFNGRNVGEFPDYWYGSATWGQLNALLKQACDYYWLPYIDQHDGPVNAFTIQTLIGEDGVHPSEEGYKKIGEWLSGELRRLIG